MNVQDIVKEVRVALDQNMSSEALAELSDVDTLSLDEIIESKIEDAATAVLQSAPVGMLDDISEDLSGTVSVAQGSEVGVLNLPSDFLRLVVFSLSGWPYMLYETSMSDSPLYMQAHSKYGVLGGKPILFVVPGGTIVEGGQTKSTNRLEVYPCPANPSVTIGKYVKMPKRVIVQPDSQAIPPVVGSDTIGLGQRLLRPTVYYAAYLVSLALQEKDSAERLLGVCNELMKV